jgi:putative transcriptional regulator
MTLSKNNLRRFREKHAMTQEMLAEKVGVTRQTMISIERERYTPSLELSLKLAKVFGCKVEDLFAL